MDNVFGLPAGPFRLPVPERQEHLDTLTRVCVDDLFSAFGLREKRRSRAALEAVARIPARRLARQVLTYDAIVGDSGLGAGGAWALKQLARRAEVEGAESVPLEGPLLVVSNHPGLADAVALFAATPRPDLRVIAAERPFLGALPNTSRHLITVAETSPGRFGPVRAATRHLRDGGAVLTFPGGRIEPDPAILPGAIESLGSWSASVDLFAKLTPGLAIVPVAVSGVISPAALRNPLTRLRRRRSDQEWLAATLQMLTPALRGVTVRVAFGNPIVAGKKEAVGGAVRMEMRRLIESGGAR
ncbi:MAG TPA: 1-acyl-sn-glycerol-3-phosphate acyltransferase [Rubrobacteraceae bacterium]|nr:1-acyl-sn-glycerol-3-phosphate acyltransferase [Rubrobacteraceae bacterium]